MTSLFAPFPLRTLTLRNRLGVSPMCMYSARDGEAQDWHLVHYGALATGGAGLVMLEATAVDPRGRISPHDLGIWSDRHIAPLARIARFIQEQGAVPAIQLAHAGRKACTHPPSAHRPGNVPAAEGGWTAMAPSPVAFPGLDLPEALRESEIRELIAAFQQAAVRAHQAGFQVVEIHAAHGYLLHQFLSPHSNLRRDAWGGDLQGRSLLLREVVAAIRSTWPEALPLLVRLSCTEYLPGGWDLDQSLALTGMLKDLGVDLVDCSSGGNSPAPPPHIGPGFQVPFSARLRQETGVPTAAVGLITEPEQAEAILSGGHADLVFLGRELLRNPHWPLLAASRLGASGPWPDAYLRARP